MICDACGAAEREQREVRFFCDRGDRLIAVERVPAEVCATCVEAS